MELAELEKQLIILGFNQISENTFEKKYFNITYRCMINRNHLNANFEISAKLMDTEINIPSERLVNINHLKDINYAFDELFNQFEYGLKATLNSLSEISKKLKN